MMKLMRLFVPLCVSAVLLAAGDSVISQPRSFAIDPAQTKVEFTLGSLLHTVHGDFKLKRGTLRFDAQSGKVSGELVVDAASGESGSPARDKRMHASILESAKYPEIVFRPDRVDGKVAPEGRSEVQVHGVFAIHGVEHEMLVPATVGAADGQYNVTVTFEVPYVKWCMKNPSTLMLRVNDKVEIIVQTVAHPSEPRP
jgi:polyisoprenoid-binding protein YceI